jgi:hypothetical protein
MGKVPGHLFRSNIGECAEGETNGIHIGVVHVTGSEVKREHAHMDGLTFSVSL